jgi:hypothetical protein
MRYPYKIERCACRQVWLVRNCRTGAILHVTSDYWDADCVAESLYARRAA